MNDKTQNGVKIPDGLPWIQGNFNKRTVFNKHKQLIGTFLPGSAEDAAFAVRAANKLYEETLRAEKGKTHDK